MTADPDSIRRDTPIHDGKAFVTPVMVEERKCATNAMASGEPISMPLSISHCHTVLMKIS